MGVAVDSNVVSVCSRHSVAFLGCENGSILKVDLNGRKVVGKYDSESKLPMTTLRWSEKFIIAGTCHG